MARTSHGLNGKSQHDETTTREHPEQPKLYTTLVSARFLFLSLALSSLLAFVVGRTARLVLIPPIHPTTTTTTTTSLAPPPPNDKSSSSSSSSSTTKKSALPPPTVQDGKIVPRTIYTSKNFDTSASATSTSLLIQKSRRNQRQYPHSRYKDDDGEWYICDDGDDDDCVADDDAAAAAAAASSDTSVAAADDEEHLPAGQHLLVDIKNVDAAFLDDEERLAQAMVDVASQSQLTLLSYHCHGLEPMGVSCAGVLLESHVSFHTWPTEGVITIDLFTCGSGLLVPVLPNVLKLFGVPQKSGVEGEAVEPPGVIWAHKLRGFRNALNPLAGDLGRTVLGVMDLDLKREVASTQTKFQDIHVYDVINPRFRDLASYERSISNDDSYESRHAELFQPDRVVFLDGTMQSNRYGNAPYHESLVHPGMFSHEHPRRVAIIGGGEGSTLREVLKHDTLEKVVMIEIDEMMVEFSKTYLESWSDCGDIVGSTPSCFDDPRADVYYEDALSWFIDRFGAAASSDVASREETFDIIIMDALDPRDNVEFADGLYRNDVFIKALYNALSDNGIIVMQLGESPSSVDPSDDYSIDENRAMIVDGLAEVGIKNMHIYEQSHSSFSWPWSHMLACKSRSCQLGFMQNEAEIELAIHQRIKRTHSGKPPLQYFDGPTMKSFQMPHKVFEVVYCRKTPTPIECNLLENSKQLMSVRTSSLEVKPSGLGENVGNGIFTKVDIPKESLIIYQDPVIFHARAMKIVDKLLSNIPEAEDLEGPWTYAVGYGFGGGADMGGNFEDVVVDSSIVTFINHGCNGTSNFGDFGEFLCHRDPKCTILTETLPNPEEAVLRDYRSIFNAYSPVYYRHDFIEDFDIALRDIRAGEEILMNYAYYETNIDALIPALKSLKEQCEGRGEGDITEYRHRTESTE